MGKLKELLSAPVKMSPSTHGGIMIMAGCYIGYLGISMYRNTASGESEMSMSTTVILMIVLLLGALFTVGYGIWLIYTGQQELKKYMEEHPGDDPEEPGGENAGTDEKTKESKPV